MKISPDSTRTLLVASLLLSTFAAQAFPYDPDASNVPSGLYLTGTNDRDSGVIQTYNIPISDWPERISANITGGDGGNAKARGEFSGSRQAEGGSGAKVIAAFKVHPSNPDSLRPGGQLRLVLGNRGNSSDRHNDAAGGGGGGTALLYLAPTANAEWIELAVAGGGGGALASIAPNFTYEGSDALTTTDGGDGGAYTGSGGSNGAGGKGILEGAGGGGGVRTVGTGTNEDPDDSRPGGQPGRTGFNLYGEDYTGGVGGFTSGGGEDGGYGYGAGGGSYCKDNDDPAMGGGGGGYSGGGSGQSERQGGGGGSYVLSDYAYSSNIVQGTTTETPGSAFVSYTPAYGNTLDGPTLILTGGNPAILFNYESYTDAGATGRDVYGNDLTATISQNTVQNGVPGIYSVTYTVEDQFGNSGSISRTVQIVTEHKPTFSISGNVTVNEDSGSHSQTDFASNFNANDSGQSLSHYTLSNNNNALFATQPAIDASGTLTFTPAANASGSATVTAVATDTGIDPDYATSAPLTFSITVSGVNDPPTFSILGDLARGKNSGSHSIDDFATNFDANDSGQSQVGYVVTNDNNSLFSVQPAVDIFGTLTFTPASDTLGRATVTITGYDNGGDNNSSQQTFTITVEEVDPTAAFSVDKTLILPGQSVQFTDASSDAVEWEWDFDNDGTIDSTEQNPTHTYTTAGTYSVKLNVRNTSDDNSIVQDDLVRVVGYGIANADGSSTDFANGSGNQNSLGKGWYGKKGDNGVEETPDWSTGLTTGTAGVLTQTNNSGTATRFGQFFANNLTGSTWALSFDLGGTGKFSQVRIWGGTLADNPSGTVLTGDDSAPASSLVDANGWTSVLYQGAVSATGTVTLNIDADLGQFDVLTIQFKSGGSGIGTTYDNFAFVSQSAPTASDDSYETVSPEPASGNVLDNDSMPAAYNDPVAVTAVADDSSNIGTQVTLPSGALLTLNTDGSFSYDPNGAFDATTEDSFSYTIGNGAGSSTAIVTLTITVPGPLETFRTTYGLASDGSDDNLDWSNNEIANILYYLFGLGDPIEANIDRSRLPVIAAAGGPANTIAFSYLRPAATTTGLKIEVLTSTDLSNWSTPATLGADYLPVSEETEDLGDGYERVTQTYNIIPGDLGRFYIVGANDFSSQ